MVSYRGLLLAASFAGLLLTPSAAMGEPLCVEQPDWSDYFFAYPTGCIIGDKLISRFTWSPGSGTNFNFPSPIDTGDLVGLSFTFFNQPNVVTPFSAAAGQTKVFSIGYTTTVIAGDPLIGGSLFSLTSVNLTGTGTIQATEMTCVGGTFTRPISGSPTCSSGVAEVSGSTSPQLSDSAVFAPVTTVDTILSITLSGGTSGTAAVDGLQMLVAQVPEPAAALVLATGFSGLMCMRRRRPGRGASRI